jgi:formylglycine-generating enzyme required for sulfatase activity
MSERHVELAPSPEGTLGSLGRSVIAVIGIDRYHHWQRLANAVHDATGTSALFGELGFEQVTAPLLDDHATGKAIQSLVTDDLMTLGPDDSLVVFYAGHGGTRKHRLGDQVIKTGYLIPVDASDKVSTWIDLEGWLRAVSLLPAKHILVVLDACHSGIALDPIIKWRDLGSWKGEPLSTLKARRSRRIITSALDDQVALDSGPMYGHSLFTGCFIEGLTHGIRGGGSRVTTGSELGLYVQRRVETYPDSRQTPDFGTFAFDDRGEMVIPLLIDRLEDYSGDKPEPASAELVATPRPGPLAATIPTPIPPPPKIPLPPPNNAASIAPTPEPSEPASAKPVATPTPGPRRRKRPTPGLPPPNVSREGGHDRGRRWIVIGAVGAMLAIALIGYSNFGRESSRVDPPVDAPAAAADRRPDAQVLPERSPSAEPSSGACPAGMVPVPAGTFQMGSPDGVGDTDEHPQHEVTLSAYCIDKTEVTVKAYAVCVAAKGCSAAPRTVKGSGYSVADVKLYSQFCNSDDRPNHPINCVDWNQAAAYCTWFGKEAGDKTRLPTEAEWEYAARGNDGRAYPWGNEAPSAKLLNACGTECVGMAKRVLNKEWEKMYDASDGWETTAPVGSFRAGASPFGALDMAGNVWEWTADWYGDYTKAAATNPRGAETGTARVGRGGGWSSDDAGLVRAAVRNGVGASVRDSHVGFRCARGD